jgi:chromosome segregation ATPase
VELYGVQQQLARQQMLIEKEQDQHSSYTYQRKQKEHSLAEVQKLYQNMSQQLKQIQEQSKNLRNEMETSALRVKYLSEAHSTVQQDIALTMRATEKTSTDIFKSQDNKLKQDLYIDKLTMQIAQLEEQIGLITAQSQAQAHETKSTKQALSEAAMELEVLFLEKKKLNHQWNNSLIGMKRRDEAYSAMVTARNIQQQEINSMNTQLDNYKKSIIKEQEHNEQLTLLKNKIDADIIRIKQSIDQCEVKMEALKVDYMTYTRALQETEQTLTVVNGECTIKKNELSSLRMQIEREALDKRRLEDSVMENMMQRLTMDKSTQYSLKSLNRFRNTAKELEIVLANVKNEISQTTLEMAEITSVFKNLYQMLDKENAAISNQNDLISKSEGEITRNNAYIKRKQTQIDQLNKKIDSKVSKMGMTEDMGPWEAKIDDLHKQISDSMEKCAKMQQHWLRQQNDLVKKTNEIDELTFSIDNLRKEELILSQKKLKLDSELENDEKSCHTISNAIESLQKEMVHLNTLITTKRGEQDTLEQKNSLLEKDFISALKEAELEFLQLQSRVHQLKEEKERLINSVMESESVYFIMSLRIS